MRTLAAIRDPIALLLALAAAATLLAFQEGPLVALLAALSVLVVRMAARPLFDRWVAARPAPAALAAAAAMTSPPSEPSHARAQAHEWFSPLTPREAEVALCLSEGLSNKETAWRLHIKPDTVETHVFNIMNKLTLHSRTQIGVWIVEQRARAGLSTKPTT
jgi:DNA-binding NarL/FixJ family response regulator